MHRLADTTSWKDVEPIRQVSVDATVWKSHEPASRRVDTGRGQAIWSSIRRIDEHQGKARVASFDDNAEEGGPLDEGHTQGSCYVGGMHSSHGLEELFGRGIRSNPAFSPHRRVKSGEFRVLDDVLPIGPRTRQDRDPRDW